MLPRITPITPIRIKAAFDDPEFICELKHDGFRALAHVEAGACRLISRKNIQYKSFASLCALLAELPVRDANIDGELVRLDGDARSQFIVVPAVNQASLFEGAFKKLPCPRIKQTLWGCVVET